MPRFLFSYFNQKNLKEHFIAALWLGLYARLITSFFVYGPQALDDYKHGVIPSYQLFAGLEFTLPDYRSPLLNWILAGWLHVGSFAGIESALGQVRWMYVLLGVLSLSAVLGAYVYSLNFKNKYFGKILLYFCALHPLMPFVGTRAFGESFAMGFVLLAFGLLEHGRRNQRSLELLVGFWVLGFATLFRFHVGLLYLSYLAVLLIDKKFKFFLIGGLLGLLTLGEQLGVDAIAGKDFLGTLVNYMNENSGGGVKYGVMPWYNTWLLVLGLGLFPFSLVFYDKFKSLWKEHWRLIVPFLVFVTAHSLAPHKEERFMYPIIGLLFVFLAYLWAEKYEGKWVRRIFSPLVVFLFIIGLPIACLNNTQVGEIEPLAYPQSQFKAVSFLDLKSLVGPSKIKDYFIRPPSQLKTLKETQVTSLRIDDEFRSDPQWEAVVLMTSEESLQVYLKSLENLQTQEAQCHDVEAASSLMDSLIYKMNPRHNQRRRPTWYVVCERFIKVGL